MTVPPLRAPSCFSLFSLHDPQRSVSSAQSAFYSLECQFQSELNLSCRKRRADCPECCAAAVRVGRSEVGLVEEIERLHPEFQLGHFINRQPKVLFQAEI